MKTPQYIKYLIIIFTFVPCLFVQAQFYSFETNYLRIIYYDENHRYLIPHLARCFENSFEFHRKLFTYEPSDKVNILLHDFSDYGAGGATTVPFNYVIVALEPFEYVYETCPTNERMNWLMHHELAHIVAMDKAAGFDLIARRLFFGKVEPVSENPISIFYSYLTNPRRYAPRWYHEGIAVFFETWMAGGVGRTLGGYDEMVFRSMLRDNNYFYDVVGLESEGTTIDFQVGANSYLYGTRFVSYLAKKYGPMKVMEWFNRTPESSRYFASQFKKVYSNSLDDEWSKWVEWEKKWQKSNIESITANPTTKYRDITPEALGSVSRAYYDSTNRKIYTAVLYPGSSAHIASIDIDNGQIKKIQELTSPALYYVASLAFDPSSGNIFYTPDNSRAWRDLNCVNLTSGENQVKIKDARTGDLVFNNSDKSLWGIQHHNGFSTIVRFLPPYGEWQNVLSMDYGKDIFDIDISPDGMYLTASLIEVDGRQRLIRMRTTDLLQGNSGYEVLFEFEDNAPANFVHSSDGKKLFGTSYYSGVSNIYSYSFETEDMSIITNTETGFFRPIAMSSDSLIAFRYSGKGFTPVVLGTKPVDNVKAINYLGQEIVNDHTLVKNWNAGSPARIKLDSLTSYQGKYQAVKNIQFASVYPIIAGFKDYAAFGLRLNFQDPLGINKGNISALYSPIDRLDPEERYHLSLDYYFWPWTINATYNRTDFYDLFGPTKTSRRGNSLGIRYKGSLINDHPKLLEYSFHFAGYSNLERLPDYQNVAASFDRYISINANLHYSFLQKSLGGVEKEKGVEWQVNFRSNYVNSKFYPLIFLDYDQGFQLSSSHSSLWLRNSLGYASGDRNEPFANFYFGGFGNNWIDYQSVQRYREYYSFPGVELNEIGGTNFYKLMMEWTIPPLRFRRLGFTGLYLRWTRLALFSSGIITNFDHDDYRRKFASIGGQIDNKIVMFSMLNSTFSLGYAVAVEEGQRYSNEFMISLTILQ